uniref:Chemokine interleukin-8-like domain-containing protein n=1 Tax=Varanus komodoensis TaxID=61221 RepID=A0A8D2LYA5_VARKO
SLHPGTSDWRTVCFSLAGMPTSGRGRCLCHGRSVTLVRMSNVAKVEFHPPSSSCDQEELIVYFKRNGKRRCLDVNMDQGRRIREVKLSHNLEKSLGTIWARWIRPQYLGYQET